MAGYRELPRALRTLGAWRVQSVVLTHANLDHYSALPDLIDPLGIERVYVSPQMLRELQGEDGGAIAALGAALGDEDVAIVPVSAGATIAIGGESIEILSPLSDVLYENVNDTSLVGLLRLPTSQGERRVLLTGDIEDAAIDALLDRNPALCVDVLEVPHHGSARSAAMEFVQQVNPAVVIQSTGPSRAHDERWSGVRTRRAWLSTAEVGSVAVEILRSGAMRLVRTSEFGNSTLADESQAAEIRHRESACAAVGRGEIDEERLAHNE
jgi:competence protein ComEC